MEYVSFFHYFSIPRFVKYSNSNSHPFLNIPNAFKVFEIQFQLGGACDGRQKAFQPGGKL